ncbi:DUF805 domain-containing protein [Escherichia coli]|uniref:DUF805 domain-containing protein n=1 Tax=Escherichia coli TaxID=562 RepID=UPI002227FC28|nr:DUF805 domain-containing protein [Escherichia coli]MCW3448514.1 DUF805 domain-containing protein [Escherichia coli]
MKVRRLHDIGLCLVLVYLGIPYIGGFILFVMYCIPSEKGIINTVHIVFNPAR